MTYCLELRKRKTILLNHCQKGCGSGHIKVFCLYLRKARIQRSFFQRSDPDFSSSIYQKEKKSNFQFFLLITYSFYGQIRFFFTIGSVFFERQIRIISTRIFSRLKKARMGLFFSKTKSQRRKSLAPLLWVEPHYFIEPVDS